MKLLAKAFIVGVGVISFMSRCAAATAQDVLVDLYGKGVHQFFACQYMEAMENFTKSIDNGSKDPRNYYFRGLARMRLGMCDAGADDWEMGARMEMEDASGLYAVGRALERVQGADRLQIEKLRREAKLQAQLDRKTRMSIPIQVRQPDAGVLRDPKFSPPKPGGEVVPVTPAPASGEPGTAAPAATDPFGDEVKDEKKDTKPAEPAPDLDIFGN